MEDMRIHLVFMTWGNTSKMGIAVPKNGFKENARGKFFSSFFDSQGISKNICPKFCEANIKQFTRN